MSFTLDNSKSWKVVLYDENGGTLEVPVMGFTQYVRDVEPMVWFDGQLRAVRQAGIFMEKDLEYWRLYPVTVPEWDSLAGF